jgi:glycolate oxidase iron-sulfur subunit
MQTRFTASQLSDPQVAVSEQILRKCVHCGFCTATCPTYVLLGDELDGPRGRIYLIKDMLENERPATAPVVRHIDRCLSCLGCMTACPSGVHYQHLIDHAREHIERTYRRPLRVRVLRELLARTLPYPGRLRAAMRGAVWLRRLVPGLRGWALAGARPWHSLRALLRLAPEHLPRPLAPGRLTQRAAGPRRGRVALLTGCAQSVLAPQTHEASARLLARAGVDVVPVPGCCGAIVHHLGRSGQARVLAARLLGELQRAGAHEGLDAVVVNASGCGTHLKDLGHVLRHDAALAAPAATASAITRDVTEVLAQLGLPMRAPSAASSLGGLAVAYHSPCSMQHGQGLDEIPRALLRQAGYAVAEIPEGHLCCGSAGTYNILQPELAAQLRARKLAHIRATGAAVVATGNIGCITQLAEATLPVLHTVELLDFATGGPLPDALAGIARSR